MAVAICGRRPPPARGAANAEDRTRRKAARRRETLQRLLTRVFLHNQIAQRIGRLSVVRRELGRDVLHLGSVGPAGDARARDDRAAAENHAGGAGPHVVIELYAHGTRCRSLGRIG